MKKIILIVIMLSIFLTGCWDMTDVETLDIIPLIGIDAGDNGDVKVTIQELAPNRQTRGGMMGGGGAPGQKPFHSYTLTGKTVNDTLQRISKKTALTKLFLAHMRAVIISEKLARSKGVEDVMDFLLRYTEIRRRAWILIAREGELDKIMNIDFGLGVHTGTIIDEMLRDKRLNLLQPAMNINSFVRAIENPGQEPYTAGVYTVKKEKAEGEKKDDEKSETYDLEISGAAVFRGDKMVGWLDDMETAGLQWTAGKVKGGILTFKYGDNDISMKVERMNAKTRSVMTDGKIQINVFIDIKTRINESEADLDFSRKEIADKVHDLQNEVIKNEVTMAIKKSRELDADIFQFGGRIFDRYPKYWIKIVDNWDSLYKDLPIAVDVKSVIENVGLVKRSGFLQKTYKRD